MFSKHSLLFIGEFLCLKILLLLCSPLMLSRKLLLLLVYTLAPVSTLVELRVTLAPVLTLAVLGEALAHAPAADAAVDASCSNPAHTLRDPDACVLQWK